eukprot:TRINITY_DN43722_c0_g1_i1.p1 TRINITY_DN43722_c0_g1~~TRINITY_DN43722_c0_g1_i1.p1  ORF type:complete len:813 (-),score=127.31 TRINITY_DN43722_c0_g1_i1:122-2560(-)
MKTPAMASSVIFRFGRSRALGLRANWQPTQPRPTAIAFCGATVLRGKFDVTRVPPWKRWPRAGMLRMHPSKLPEIVPSIDVLACNDPELVADAICEVVPWKRRRVDHPWLHEVCTHVRELLPVMGLRDVVRVILAFSELHTKRRTTSLLFYDYETYTMLFQALPVEAATAKTIVPLLRAYRRMDVRHEAFVRAAFSRVVSGDVELQPAELVEAVSLHGFLKIRSPALFEFAVEVLDLRFAYFSEDQVGELARTFCRLRYRCSTFIAVLSRELPYRIHEYAWWNLIDIAEMYLELDINDRDIIRRIGNEAFKLVFSMKYEYPAKALKVLAFLETADARTFRLLIRSVPRRAYTLSPQVTAETIMACATVGVDPTSKYHSLRGARLYGMLANQLTRSIGALSSKMTCDVFASLARVGRKEVEMALAVEIVAANRPYKFHAEHLVSLLRDFASLDFKSPSLRAMLLLRREELAECTPSALCALPAALAQHRPPMPFALTAPRSETSPGLNNKNELIPPTAVEEDNGKAAEEWLLHETSKLLCKPGAYALPSDPRAFKSKDDFWFKQLRQRNFRLRRRAKMAGGAVAPASDMEANAGVSVLEASAKDKRRDDTVSELVRVEDDAFASSAIVHVTQKECMQLVVGCEQLDWRDETLLNGVVAWLCSSRRHAELEPSEVARLLGAFAALGYATPLLRASLEHALLRVAPVLAPADCVRALGGALDLGMGVRSVAVRALLRRCTGQLAVIPPADAAVLVNLGVSVRRSAEEEIDTAVDGKINLSSFRLPLEVHLFSEAVESRLAPKLGPPRTVSEAAFL